MTKLLINFLCLGCAAAALALATACAPQKRMRPWRSRTLSPL
jgi:hypothetical protein